MDISKAIPIKFSTEENIVEIRSEHLSRKNSIDELNASKVVPQNQKKGIITWFSEKFSKDKKQLKNSAIEVEENKLGFKENKEIFIEKAIMEEDIENLIKSTNEDKSSINNQSIIIDNTGISQTNKEENPITPITINNENIIINDNVAKKNIANEPNINKKENLNYIQNQVNEINENFNEKIDETLQQSTEIIEEVEENAVELSICAHLINQKNEEDLTEIFNANKVLEEHYFKDPIKVLTNPNLMVKIEDHLYEWKIAEPLIIAKLVYHQVKILNFRN